MLTSAVNSLSPTPYSEAAIKIATGDLLLCSGNSLVSQAIKQATQSTFSHIGLILQLPLSEQWLVLESVESIGVRCVTLYEGYLTNYMGNNSGYDGQIYIARHNEMVARHTYFSRLYAKAFSLLGDHYNEQDIFNIATRIALRNTGINQQGELIGSNSYICSEYVYTCFNAIGISLPFDQAGFIAPADIANLPEVAPVLQLQVPH